MAVEEAGVRLEAEDLVALAVAVSEVEAADPAAVGVHQEDGR